MREVITYGNIDDSGDIRITKRRQFMENIALLGKCRVKFTVRKIYNRRSLAQNAYIHGVLIPEVREGLIDVGYRPDEVTFDVVKDFLKGKFLTADIVNETTGECLQRIKPTSELTTTEMMDFINDTADWAAEDLHREIPMPNQQMEIWKQ